MLFLRQAMLGVFLAALSVGALGWAGNAVWRAVSVTMADDAPDRPRREPVVSVRAVTVTPGPVAPVIHAFGEVRSTRTVRLRAAAGGDVVALSDPFRDGVAVRAGQVLVRLDPAEAAAAHATARADLADAEAADRDARHTVELAREDLAVTREQAALRADALARQRDLDDRGVGSAAAVETAALAAAQARQAVVGRRRALAEAEAARDLAVTAVERARIALSEAARRLADTTLHAPFDGVLSDVAATVGARVSAGDPLAQVVDPDALEVAFRLSTTQFSRLTGAGGALADRPVTVTLDPGTDGAQSPASGLRVSPVVAEGQTGRALFARLEAPDGFRPGDIVTVTVTEPILRDVARLPAGAMDANGDVLVIGPDDRLREDRVTILRRQDNTVLVRAPDLAGLRVVADRGPALGAGIKVEVTGRADPQPVSAAADGVMLSLGDDRRAALIARLEADPTLSAPERARLRAALQGDRVPAALVRRIESGRGG